jgi:hypothetical protein
MTDGTGDDMSLADALAGLRLALVPVAARETITAEIVRYRQLAATWELATWAALIGELDESTAARIAERMRALVDERAAAERLVREEG